MSGAEAFYAAARESPADGLPWLVFADWLDDRGDAHTARLARVLAAWLESPGSPGGEWAAVGGTMRDAAHELFLSAHLTRGAADVGQAIAWHNDARIPSVGPAALTLGTVCEAVLAARSLRRRYQFVPERLRAIPGSSNFARVALALAAARKGDKRVRLAINTATVWEDRPPELADLIKSLPPPLFGRTPDRRRLGKEIRAWAEEGLVARD